MKKKIFLNLFIFLPSFCFSANLGELRKADEQSIKEGRSINETYREVRDHDRKIIARNNGKEVISLPLSKLDSYLKNRTQELMAKSKSLSPNSPENVLVIHQLIPLKDSEQVVEAQEFYLNIEGLWTKVDQKTSLLDLTSPRPLKEEIAPDFTEHQRKFKDKKEVQDHILNARFDTILLSHPTIPSLKNQLKHLYSIYQSFDTYTLEEEIILALAKKLVFEFIYQDHLYGDNDLAHNALKLSRSLLDFLSGEPPALKAKRFLDYFLGYDLLTKTPLSHGQRTAKGKEMLYHQLKGPIQKKFLLFQNLTKMLKNQGHRDLLPLDSLHQLFQETTHLKDYIFQGPLDDLRTKNEELFKTLWPLEPQEENLSLAKDLGLHAVVLSDQYHAQGETEKALISQNLALSLLDLILGLVPVFSPGKDLIESVFGINIVTGESLTYFERSLGLLGLVTLGLGNSLYKSARLAFAVVKRLKNKIPSVLTKTTFDMAEELLKSLKNLFPLNRIKKENFLGFLKELALDSSGGATFHYNLTQNLASLSPSWASFKSLVHTIRGTSKIMDNGTYKLLKGLHTERGLQHFLAMNAKALNFMKLKTVKHFPELNRTEAILKQTLPNGVSRLQFPKNAFANGPSFRKAMAKGPSGEAMRGVKTLFPKDFSIQDIAKAAHLILEKNKGKQTLRLVGFYKGVKTVVIKDLKTGKALTVFPAWNQ